MDKKWVFWLIFSVVVTLLVFSIFVLLLKGVRRSRRVEEQGPPRQQTKIFNTILDTKTVPSLVVESKLGAD